jgi:hypothetical protein
LRGINVVVGAEGKEVAAVAWKALLSGVDQTKIFVDRAVPACMHPHTERPSHAKDYRFADLGKCMGTTTHGGLYTFNATKKVPLYTPATGVLQEWSVIRPVKTPPHI